MNTRKIEMRQNRLNLAQAAVEAHKKVLAAKGLDAKLFEKDSKMRHLLAEVRKVRHSLEALKREPLEVVPAEKGADKSAKPAKPAKEAAPPKTPKPPKEKKPRKQEEAPSA